MNKINIVEITQTCYACPSQWEGKLDDGRSIYIRYRFGDLSIEIDGKVVLEKTIGDYYDGIMDLEDVYKVMNEEELNL